MIKDDYDKFCKLSQQSLEKRYIENINLDTRSKYSSFQLDVDYIYLVQNQTAFMILRNIIEKNKNLFSAKKPQDAPYCLDIGSQISIVSLFSILTSFYFLDPGLPSRVKEGEKYKGISGIQVADLNMILLKGEAQKINLPNNSLAVITSLHAIEHFGLGRYGDTLDCDGDIKAIRECYRLLAELGCFISSIPITSKKYERIAFNINRLYHPRTYLKMLRDTGFKILSVILISGPNNAIIKEEKEKISELDSGHLLRMFNDNKDEKIIDDFDNFFKAAEGFNLNLEDIPDFAMLVVAQK